MPTASGVITLKMSKNKERIDKLLLEKGLVESRAKGQAIIMAGEVLVNGEPVTKSGQLVPRDAVLHLVAPPPYVSRGGIKLAAALDSFKIDISGRICADVGACTGGFTDVLLQNGASKVFAIDVGYGQLDWNLRHDSRVVVMERTNARYLDTLPSEVDFVAIDVSFISLKLVLPAAEGWIQPEADIVVLVKPQFEAGRKYVGKGGIVRDSEVHREVLSDLLAWTSGRDITPVGLIRSPITRVNSNLEFLLWLQSGKGSDVSTESLLQSAGFSDS